jgi:hypothetical protein
MATGLQIHLVLAELLAERLLPARDAAWKRLSDPRPEHVRRAYAMGLATAISDAAPRDRACGWFPAVIPSC